MWPLPARICKEYLICLEVASGTKKGNLYILDGETNCPGYVAEANIVTTSDSDLWRSRMAHIQWIGQTREWKQYYSQERRTTYLL